MRAKSPTPREAEKIALVKSILREWSRDPFTDSFIGLADVKRLTGFTLDAETLRTR